jgi:chromosome segregation ATPase
MEDPRGLLDEAVASNDPGAPLLILRWAAALSAELLRQATSNGEGGELSAIEAVILLDDVLAQMADLLSAVPSLLSVAGAGPAVESYLRDREADLRQVTNQVSTARATLSELRDREAALRERQAALDDLRRDVAQLRRLERLVTALDELNEQRNLIAERLAALRERTEDTEQAIATDGAELLRLTEAQRTLLADQAREALEEAATAQERLAAEEDRAERERAAVETASRRHAKLIAERDTRLAAIAAQAEADSSIAAALADLPGFDDQRPALNQVRSFAEDVQRRLRELDGALRRVLDDREQGSTEGRMQLAWRDRS